MSDARLARGGLSGGMSAKHGSLFRSLRLWLAKRIAPREGRAAIESYERVQRTIEDEQTKEARLDCEAALGEFLP